MYFYILLGAKLQLLLLITRFFSGDDHKHQVSQVDDEQNADEDYFKSIFKLDSIIKQPYQCKADKDSPDELSVCLKHEGR